MRRHRVCVLHAPVTPPPAPHVASSIVSPSSTLSHAWHREAHLRCCEVRIVSRLGGKCSQGERGKRYVRGCQQEQERRARSYGADQRRGTGWLGMVLVNSA